MTPPSAPTTTIRGLLEGIRDDNAGMPGHTARRSFDRAVAALDLLDKACGCNPVGRVMTLGPVTHRIVLDDSSLLGGVVPTNTKEDEA